MCALFSGCTLSCLCDKTPGTVNLKGRKVYLGLLSSTPVPLVIVGNQRKGEEVAEVLVCPFGQIPPLKTMLPVTRLPTTRPLFSKCHHIRTVSQTGTSLYLIHRPLGGHFRSTVQQWGVTEGEIAEDQIEESSVRYSGRFPCLGMRCSWPSMPAQHSTG